METKVAKQIERICKADVDLRAKILLEFGYALFKVYDDFHEEDAEIQEVLKELKVDGVESFSYKLLDYWGFDESDAGADNIIDEYFESISEDRMDIMKKDLIEHVLEYYNS